MDRRRGPRTFDRWWHTGGGRPQNYVSEHMRQAIIAGRIEDGLGINKLCARSGASQGYVKNLCSELDALTAQPRSRVA